MARRLASNAGIGMGLMVMLAAMQGPALAQSAGQVVSQPARDVGITKTRIPPLLVQVSEHPYATTGTATCTAIARQIAALTRVVGPDFNGSAASNKQNLYAVAGSAVVNSLIPFRGVVREVSGAAGAERRKAAAVAAGIARRGFLRGLQSVKGCRG